MRIEDEVLITESGYEVHFPTKSLHVILEIVRICTTILYSLRSFFSYVVCKFQGNFLVSHIIPILNTPSVPY